MKLTSKLNPKNIFSSKKHKSVSRSHSSSSSTSPESQSTGVTTPTSVLQSRSNQIDQIDSVQFDLEQAFNLIDSNGDGRITRSELSDLLRRIGDPISPEEINLMFDEIDRDGDGAISLTEFAVISSAFGPPSCDGEIRSAFEFFDTDRDGMITADELFAVFQVIGDGNCTLDECRRMISSVDSSGDGIVCFEDFTRMMEQQR